MEGEGGRRQREEGGRGRKETEGGRRQREEGGRGRKEGKGGRRGREEGGRGRKETRMLHIQPYLATLITQSESYGLFHRVSHCIRLKFILSIKLHMVNGDGVKVEVQEQAQ